MVAAYRYRRNGLSGPQRALCLASAEIKTAAWETTMRALMVILGLALKVIVGFLIVLIAGYVVVIVYGVDESTYQCTRSPTASPAAPSTLFFKFDRYRWFILWGESDGMMKWEIPPPNMRGGLFTKVKKVGDYLQFFDFDER
jgi:hypothetical protein